MLETPILVFVIILMIIALFVSLIPFIPGPALLWAIAVIYAVLDDFERVPIIAVIFMTMFMIIGATSEFWLRYIGMKGRGGSCWGFLGSFIGGIIGTIVIPIPILGTLLGAILGALIIEFMRLGEIMDALKSGRAVLEMYLVNIVIEFALSLMIFSIFLFSVWVTN